MALDPLSTIAPARIKALLLPVGHITSTKYLSYVNRLQQEDIVRLGDVSPDGRPNRTMFSPLAFPSGLILYDLSIATPPPHLVALSPFEIYREPLLVVGLADGSDLGFSDESVLGPSNEGAGSSNSRASRESHGYQDFQAALEGIIGRFPRALVHRVLLFDHSQSKTSPPEGLVAIPSPRASYTTTMKTVMCDLTSQLLAEMDTYAKSLQNLPSIGTPKEEECNGGLHDTVAKNPTSRPVSASRDSRSRSPIKAISNSQHRMSMPAQMPAASASRAATPDGRPLSPPSRSQTPPTTFDEIAGTRVTALQSRQGTNDSRQQSRDRVSIQGFGAGGSGEKERVKGRGRVGTVIGALYLLAGRWPDALREHVESATIARANSDYVWLAKNLDYILVNLLMHAWVDIDFKIPPILYPGVEKATKSSNQKSHENGVDSSTASSSTQNQQISLQELVGILPDLVNNILNLYVRAWTFTEDKIPSFAFSETVIRLSKLLAVIQLSQGSLDGSGLKRIIMNAAITRAGGAQTRLTPFPSRADIITTLFRAFPNPMSDPLMPTADRITVFAGIVSVLSELGYHRKKALVLKEMVSLLLPALVQARKDGAAEMGVHPAASLATLSAAVGNGALQETDSRFGDSEYGMRSFLSLLCTEYGIRRSNWNVEQYNDQSNPAYRQRQSAATPAQLKDDCNEAITASVLDQASSHLLGAQGLKLDVLQICINICEALPDLEGVLQFSAETLRTAGTGTAPGPDSSDGSPSLPMEDQTRLMNNISRTLSAGQQLGMQGLEADYWDDMLVRGIEVADSGSTRNPAPHTRTELKLVAGSEGTASKNPFIYNPFGKRAPTHVTQVLLVAREEKLFRVTLQNLYDFDLEIEHILLETSGVSFEHLSQTVTVGPYRTQTISISGIPQASGSLVVKGCIAKIRGCRERRFPLFDRPWSLKLDLKTEPRTLVKDPHTGSAELATNQATSSILRPTVSELTLHVIDAQPNVALKNISLPQSAMMLLEGEKKSFTVILKNLSSSVPADFLSVSFKNSTTSQIQTALAEKDLVPAELYELELSAARNQPFKWLRTSSDPEPKIDPDCSLTLNIDIFGKPGLSHGSIEVDFGFLGASKSEAQDRFYTRQLTIPLAITVNASIELVRNDLIAFSNDFAWQNKQRQQGRSPTSSTSSTPESQQRHHTRRRTSKDENTFHSLLSRLGLRDNDDDEHCLLLLDFRNSWPNLLTTSVQVRHSLSKDQPPTDSWKRAYTVHETIQPGHTSRLVLILPRLYLPDPHLPIPSLNPANTRQYVVSSSKETPSPSAELAAREAFWYREELLKHIRATWREESTGRTGTINLRSLRISTRMIPSLKLEDLAISLSIKPNVPHPLTPPPEDSSSSPNPDASKITQLANSTFSIPTSTFFTLTTRLHNRTPYPVHPLLRLQPSLRDQYQQPNVALELSKRFLWNGVLQRVLPVLEGGGTREANLDFCVLCKGTYEIGASVEEVRRVKVNRKEEAGGEVQGGGQRRVWVAGEVCVIVAEEM